MVFTLHRSNVLLRICQQRDLDFSLDSSWIRLRKSRDNCAVFVLLTGFYIDCVKKIWVDFILFLIYLSIYLIIYFYAKQ